MFVSEFLYVDNLAAGVRIRVNGQLNFPNLVSLYRTTTRCRTVVLLTTAWCARRSARQHTGKVVNWDGDVGGWLQREGWRARPCRRRCRGEAGASRRRLHAATQQQGRVPVLRSSRVTMREVLDGEERRRRMCSKREDVVAGERGD